MPLVDVVNQQNIDEALLWLLTVQDHQNDQVLRAVNNLEPVTSRGRVYEAFPFEITLPPDDGQKPQNLTITFPNVGREAMRLVREYSPEKPPQAKIELILSTDPDIVEKQIDFMTLVGVDYDALSITFTLAANFIFNRKTCLGRYNSQEFPGLYYPLK